MPESKVSTSRYGLSHSSRYFDGSAFSTISIGKERR